MLKRIFFFVHFLRIINAAVEQSTLPNSELGKYQAETQLMEILPSQILPFVLVQDNDDELHLPIEIMKAVIKHGRISKKTEFIANVPGQQMFFCPKQTLEGQCLALQKFKRSQSLECSELAQPSVQLEQKDNVCGLNNEGLQYNIVYKICPKEEAYDYVINLKQFYSICYNTEKRKTLYTRHKIISPHLLQSNLLIMERNAKYSLIHNNFNISNINEPFKPNLDSSLNPQKTNYRLQQLVPSTDMSLALWIKTTYQDFNFNWQHKKLVRLWNKMTDYIRSKAIQLFDSGIETDIRTGVFDFTYTSAGEVTKFSIWVKLITTEHEGMAILMNNFLDSTPSHEREKEIENFCTQNTCIDTLQDKFKIVRGRVRCCALNTGKIRQLFGEAGNVVVPLLQIAGINTEESILSPKLAKYRAEAELAKIEPSQVLPLVLYQDESRELNLPVDMAEVIAVKERISAGTQFVAVTPQDQQLFFCPQENSDKVCLAPTQFNKLEPLQCTKEAMPTMYVPSEQYTCGCDDSGIFNSIVYEICDMKKAYNYRTRRVNVYGVCYDKTNNKTVYAAYIIKSPRLLQSNLLLREQDITYPFIKNKFTPSNFQDPTDPNLGSSTNPNKPDYKVQKLVPEEDMAFALWRKSTYQNINADWQHEKLIPLWNKINEFIRLKAIQLFPENIKLAVHTRVYELPSELEDKQMSNIWIKMIRTVVPITNHEINSTREGIAILMNNFIDSESSSNAKEEVIEDFCEKNICLDALQEEFRKVGGRVRCCALTTGKIRKLFYTDVLITKMPLLEIPDINS